MVTADFDKGQGFFAWPRQRSNSFNLHEQSTKNVPREQQRTMSFIATDLEFVSNTSRQAATILHKRDTHLTDDGHIQGRTKSVVVAETLEVAAMNIRRISVIFHKGNNEIGLEHQGSTEEGWEVWSTSEGLGSEKQQKSEQGLESQRKSEEGSEHQQTSEPDFDTAGARVDQPCINRGIELLGDLYARSLLRIAFSDGLHLWLLMLLVVAVFE